jgi:hypothetical protein
LKSAGEANERAGMNDVSKNPLRRSTRPLDSGSYGGNCTIFCQRQLKTDQLPLTNTRFD